MATYPGGLPDYDSKKFVDSTTDVNAANNNFWWQELVAIATELGVDVAGSASDLVTRLAISLADTGKLKLLQTCTSTTRPSSPLEGMLIYETDTKKFYKCTVGGATPTWKEIATLEEVLAKFHATTGHKHTGGADDAPKLDAANTHESPSADTHHAQAHTLGSHTTKAHSELTGVGADDHHAQSHKLNSHTVPDGDISLNSKKITSLLAGTANTHAVNKGQLDSGLSGKISTDATLTVFPINFSAVWASGYTGNLHFQVQVSENADYSTPAVDVESKDAQTNWIYDNGVQWVAIPSGGVDVVFNGHRIAYKVNTTLKRNTLYYVRVRQYQVESSSYENWIYKTLII